ncbi:PDZ domain-containing protein [Halpernia sp.]|uniref:PDZ domain-containing protein n=1 Tax=Halpernia sp. TaxID=2782209 RepID=UPI003A8E3A6C
MKIRLLFFAFLFLHFFSAQESGFQVNSGRKTVIHFQLINNLIFIPLNVNGVNLTFLLDSGVAETILFSLEDKEVSFKNTEKVKFSGLGDNKEISGLKSVKNDVKIGKDFEDNSHTIYLILNEEFNFSSHVGIPVNGIIGYHFFKNHPIQIDYVSKKITVFNDDNYYNRKKRKFDGFEISVEDKKPYMTASVKMTNEAKPSKLLIDLGNSDAMWLFPKLIKDFVYNRPNIDDYLGRGFNGDIYGKRSRIKELSIGNFNLEKPLTAMPDEYSIQHLNLAKDRKGSIGNEVMRRFTVIFDYPNSKIYLKKNRNFHEPFLFNMSGLDIKHDGMEWDKDLVKVNTENKTDMRGAKEAYNSSSSFQYKFTLKPIYSVAACRKDSPAFLAGIRKDDLLLKINNKKAADFTLQDIFELLKSTEGRKINLEVKRKFEILKFSFTLEDPIPYEDQ